MITDNDNMVAAILALGVDRGGNNSPADLVARFDATRTALLKLRETKSREELEAWERHAHLTGETRPRPRGA